MLALVPAELVVSEVLIDADRITIRADPREASASCPACLQRSRRIHSRYDRRLADLPWQGRTVAIVVTVRRFRCGKSPCECKIFVGAALGGRDRTFTAKPSAGRDPAAHRYGTRRCRRPSSGPSSRPASEWRHPPPIGTPTVIGIDDFAWKRGQHYGTVICDLERRRIIDLLPDRQPATVEAWLVRYPGINAYTELAERSPGTGANGRSDRRCWRQNWLRVGNG